VTKKDDVTAMTPVSLALTKLERTKRIELPGTDYALEDFVELPNGHYRVTIDLGSKHAGRWVDVHVSAWSRMDTLRLTLERLLRKGGKANANSSNASEEESGNIRGTTRKPWKKQGYRLKA
jgi:hypothetical protein